MKQSNIAEPLLGDVLTLVQNLVDGLVKDLDNLTDQLNRVLMLSNVSEQEKGRIRVQLNALDPALKMLQSSQNQIGNLISNLPLLNRNHIDQSNDSISNLFDLSRLVQDLSKQNLINTDRMLSNTLDNVPKLIKLLMNTLSKFA